MFTVHARKSRRFAALADALAFADAYYRRTGNVVAVTYREPRRNVR